MAKHTSPIDALPPFRDDGAINAIVETPAGQRAKLNHDPETGLFVLGKFLPEGFSFPFDFGFIPGTRAEDGDPLDVMLLAETGTAPGCLVPARLLGVLKIEERKAGREEPIRNDRILAVPLVSREYGELSGVEQMPRALREQIEHFLTSYSALDGKVLELVATEGIDAAARVVREAIPGR